MKTSTGPVELDCDAPPDSIVQGTELAGLYKPWDVRWCGIKHHLRGGRSWFGSLVRQLFGTPQPSLPFCVCGWWFPRTEHYILTFESGQEAEYEFGQCARCHTIFWERGRTWQRAGGT